MLPFVLIVCIEFGDTGDPLSAISNTAFWSRDPGRTLLKFT